MARLRLVTVCSFLLLVDVLVKRYPSSNRYLL